MIYTAKELNTRLNLLILDADDEGNIEWIGKEEDFDKLDD